MAFAVEEIDGVPVPRPANEQQIEAMVERLGDDGLAAVAEMITESSSVPAAALLAGNLPGTPS